MLYPVFYMRNSQGVCLCLNEMGLVLRHTFPLRRKVLGWDSAGGTVTHNLTLFYRIGILFDLEMGYAFVSFASEVSFWSSGKREGQVFQSVGGSLSILISLTGVSS